jgi:hypothetical protein
LLQILSHGFPGLVGVVHAARRREVEHSSDHDDDKQNKK